MLIRKPGGAHPRLSRRALLLGAAALAIPLPAQANLTCNPTPQGQACRAEVDFDTIYASYDSQHQSQWCWAACVSMLFAYYGHPVDQARIVAETYGVPADMPAGAGFVIAQQMNRDWIDDYGEPFSARLVAAFDADAGVSTLDNYQILEALADDTPLIMGARSHAMMLTLLDYFKTPYGPQVVAGGVFDPWPGIGPRGLAPDELVPMPMGGSLRFVALADIY